MFDYTKPARTKGRKRTARFLGKINNDEYPLAFALYNSAGNEMVEMYSLNGEYISDESVNLDLENIPEKHVYYLNVYENGISCLNESRKRADFDAGEKRIACIRVEFENGQFDE